MARLTAILLSGISDEYTAKLDNLWVDKITYKRTWKPFAQGLRTKMTEITLQSLILALVSLVLFYVALPNGSNSASLLNNLIVSLALTAFVTSIIASVSAIRVRCAFSKLCDISAPVAGDYLEGEHHTTYGFYYLAIRLALPSSLLIYSLGLFLFSAILAVFNTLQVSWDKDSSPYFLALPLFVSCLPIAYIIAKVIGRSVRTFRTRFTSIALPLHHCPTGNRISWRPVAHLLFTALFSTLLTTAIILIITKPELVRSVLTILTMQ